MNEVEWYDHMVNEICPKCEKPICVAYCEASEKLYEYLLKDINPMTARAMLYGLHFKFAEVRGSKLER